MRCQFVVSIAQVAASCGRVGLLYLEPVSGSIHVWVEFLHALRIDIAAPEHILIGLGLINGRIMPVLGWGRMISRFFQTGIIGMCCC